MEQEPLPQVMPKKACMITVMLEIETDDQAMEVKKVIDAAVADKKKKRYTFQIIET